MTKGSNSLKILHASIFFLKYILREYITHILRILLRTLALRFSRVSFSELLLLFLFLFLVVFDYSMTLMENDSACGFTLIGKESLDGYPEFLKTEAAIRSVL